MKAIDKIQTFVKSLNKKDFLKYSYLIIGIIIFLCLILIYRYYSKISSLKKELQKINYVRQQAKEILTKDIQIKKQKAIVDEILEKGKTFKLMAYFDEITNKLGIEKNIKEKSTSESILENLRTKGYMEVKLNASFIDLNMKQLAELLDEFEKNERIYIKNLEITKSNKTPTIDVDIIIATLQPETVAELVE